MSDYPKLLWTKDGAEITVQSAQEESDKRAEGAYGHGEAAVGAAVVEPGVPEQSPDADNDADFDNDPTFGPPGDDTHAKKAAKGGKKK
jgi:hypothetical protein